jgi:tetratricopeptide (TPR) repeat protein
MLGDMTQARKAWSQATNSPAERRGPGRRGGGNPLANRAPVYFQALALRKLGQNDRADAGFRELVEAGEAALAASDSAEKQSGDALSPRVRTATANYIAGLGYAGLGETEKARANFDAALAAMPDHFGSRIALQQLDKQ